MHLRTTSVKRSNIASIWKISLDAEMVTEECEKENGSKPRPYQILSFGKKWQLRWRWSAGFNWALI